MEVKTRTAIRGQLDASIGFFYATLSTEGFFEGYDVTDSGYMVGYNSVTGEPMSIIIEDYTDGDTFKIDADPPFVLILPEKYEEIA